QLDTIASPTPTPSPNPASCPDGVTRGIIHPDIIIATTSEVIVQGKTDFAARLRWWRQQRGLSQLELAGRAGISQRHLSFLELSRAAPSRDMVTRLATTLDLPLRQHNGL